MITLLSFDLLSNVKHIANDQSASIQPLMRWGYLKKGEKNNWIYYHFPALF